MTPPSNYREIAKTGWIKYGAYEFYELSRQEYDGNNCIFAAGMIAGHPHDTHYLWIEKDGELPTVLLLRADELGNDCMAHQWGVVVKVDCRSKG